MDIKTLDEKELKALAYDQTLIRDQAVNNLAIINQELNLRKETPEAVTEKKK